MGTPGRDESHSKHLKQTNPRRAKTIASVRYDLNKEEQSHHENIQSTLLTKQTDGESLMSYLKKSAWPN